MSARRQWLGGAAILVVGVSVLFWARIGDSVETPAPAPPANTGEIGWVTLREGITRAANEHKKLLIDVYTDWCTWCQVMDRETYAVRDIIEYVNAHYVAVRLNGESQHEVRIWGGAFTEQQVATRLGTTGFPNTVFLSSDLEPIGSQSGYLPAETFLPLLKFVQEDLVGTMDFQDFLDQDARDRESREAASGTSGS